MIVKEMGIIMNGTRIRRKLLTGTMMFVAWPAAIANAQNSTAEIEAATDQRGLGEIVVTAQKRAENVQRVPISVSALTTDQLANQKINNVVDIAAQVPNLYISQPYGDAVPFFSLRGISAVDYSLNQSAPIALYVDEVYKGLSTFTSLQIFDIERAEVLRGPQGTLFGKNATGGAVSFFTKQADPSDGFNGYVTAGLGNYNRREASGGVNIPLVNDVLAARAAFTYTKADGFVKNRTPGLVDQGDIDDWAIRFGLTFQPTDTLKMVARYTRSSSTPEGGFASIADNIQPGGVFGLGYDRTGLDYLENETDTQNFYKVRNQGVSLTTTWDISDDVTLTSVSAYDKGTSFFNEDGDISPQNLTNVDYFADAEAYSQDLRIASTDDGPFTWLVGAYYYRDRVISGQSYKFLYEFAADSDGDGIGDCADDDIDGDPLTIDPGDFFTGCAASNRLQQTRESYALYTQETLEVIPDLTLTVGLRFTRDVNRIDSYRSDLVFFNPATNSEQIAFPIFTEPPASQRRRINENLSGKIGLAYQATPDTMIYGTASRGYRGSSFNGIALYDQAEITAIDPERLDAFELGIKTEALDNRLRVNAAIFYYDYRNQQFLTSDVIPILVGADSRLWGGEIEVTAKPASTIELRLAGSYLNSRFKDGETISGIPIGGNKLLVAPEWTFSGAIDWKLIDSDVGTLTFNGAARYTGKQFYDAPNTPIVAEPGYFLQDARLTFEPANKTIALSAWVKNISNERYTTNRLNSISLFNFVYARYGRPRTWGVEATYRF